MFQVSSLLVTKFGSRKRNEVNGYEGDVTGNTITKNLMQSVVAEKNNKNQEKINLSFYLPKL